MKKIVFTLLSSLSLNSIASGLTTFKLDLSSIPPQDRAHYKEVCPNEYKIDLDKNIGEQIVFESHKVILDHKKIQHSNGSLAGAKEPYNGDYTTIVYLIGEDGFGAYEPGIYYATTVTLFGKDNNVKAFELDKTLLNHTESAELAESSFCHELSYKKSR